MTYNASEIAEFGKSGREGDQRPVGADPPDRLHPDAGGLLESRRPDRRAAPGRLDRRSVATVSVRVGDMRLPLTADTCTCQTHQSETPLIDGEVITEGPLFAPRRP